jgi:hypothetical protein
MIAIRGHSPTATNNTEQATMGIMPDAGLIGGHRDATIPEHHAPA